VRMLLFSVCVRCRPCFLCIAACVLVNEDLLTYQFLVLIVIIARALGEHIPPLRWVSSGSGIQNLMGLFDPCEISGRDWRNVCVNFTEFGLLPNLWYTFKGRLSVVCETRAWVLIKEQKLNT